MLWREATRSDVADVVALLADDALGATRELGDMTTYLAAFDAMQTEGHNHLIVGEQAGVVIATYQLTLITGLSLRASRRAQVEAVRVAVELRGLGIGGLLMADAEARARAAGCRLMQLTSNRERPRAHSFYAGLGYQPTHFGFKKVLD